MINYEALISIERKAEFVNRIIIDLNVLKADNPYVEVVVKNYDKTIVIKEEKTDG